MNNKQSTATLLLLALWVFAALPARAEPDPNFHIYLALGQSNMQGAAHIADEGHITHPRVRVLQGQNCKEDNWAYGQWRDHFHPVIRCREGLRKRPDGSTGPTGLSPVDTFAIVMAEHSGPQVTIGLVGAAYGGTDIKAHLPNCAEFKACKPPYGDISGAPIIDGTTPIYYWILDLAKKAQQTGVIKGIIFHHGESNSGQEAWLSYTAQYISRLRKDLKLDPKQVPFIAGELPRTGCCAAAHNPLVRKLPEFIENAHWVSSGARRDGAILGDRSDKLHWGTFAVKEMGKRYAKKMIAQSRSTKPATQ
ncbi:MAG: sialate O-acetylesterase [Cellvibrionaceae bacterium]|nr:sialate O-acetylesterase [Cellvibrionaceae bacterium]